MRLRNKILIAAILLAATAYFSIHALIRLYGRPLLINKLRQAFHTEITVGGFETSFPFNLRIRNLEAKNVFKVRDVLAVGGVTDILRHNIVLSELRLDGLELAFENNGHSAVLAQPAQTGGAAQEKIAEQEKIHVPALVLKKFVITDGTFRYIDKKVSPAGITLTLQDMRLLIWNVSFPLNDRDPVSFELTGKIPWQKGEQEGSIDCRGWVDFFKKSAKASLRVENIDGVYLHPYYAKYVDINKARIEKAKLKFTSDISGADNNLTAPCQLELTDIVFKPPETEKDAKTAKITAAVLGIFKAINQDKIVLDFTVRTTMDNPEFGFGALREAIRSKIVANREPVIAAKEVVLLPGKLVEGTMKGATDLTGAVISGAFTAGKELGKAFLSAFKREGN